MNSLPFRSISYIREVMNHVGMDHITDQSDAAVSMILLYSAFCTRLIAYSKKETGIPTGLFLASFLFL